MTLAATIVDWGALGNVVLTSLIAGVGASATFALAVLGVTRSSDERRQGRGAVATAYLLVGAAAGLLVLAAMVYGVVLMSGKS